MIVALRDRGALFPPDLETLTGRLPSEIEEALWDGVARGLVTADGFRAVRSLFARRAAQNAPGRHRLRRGSQLSSRTAGRWSLLPEPPADCDPDDLAEAVAEQLAARWGVVFRDLLARENLAVPWREVLWALRRMEARGTISGGRFVAGFSGEQFAHPDAVGILREIRKRPLTGETIVLSAADPLNLVGVVLPGPRIPALGTNSVSYTDGAVVTAEQDRPVLYLPDGDRRSGAGGVMEGYRHSVTSADGTRIGLLTAGEGPPLLLVHGGMGCIESWQPLWGRLTSRWSVTAMDRRGRGTSGDTEPYDLAREYQDIAAVAASLGPVDVFGHSFGATCPSRRRPAGAGAAPRPVRAARPADRPAGMAERVTAMIAAGSQDRAMASFLTETDRPDRRRRSTS